MTAIDDVEVTVNLGIPEEELALIIGEYDGLIIRSGTQVTAKVLENSGRLRGIARAGVGVDNVDIKAATKKGVVVMNTPDGNTISAAEHTVAMMMSLSRYIVQGCTTMKAGNWDRKKFMGTQLMGKTLGVIGLGRIGLAVARRSMGLKMKVIGYDPFASKEAISTEGITVHDSIDEVIKKADYITLHMPVTDDTRGLINKERLAMMKPTARIINVARGPIINEADLYEALENNVIAGAALDVFHEEPPKNRGFETLDNCIVTPHLGASTEEAQVEVAIDAAQELVDAVRGTQIRNAVNVPGLDKSIPELVKVYRPLAQRLGTLISAMSQGVIQKVEVTYRGEIATLDISALTCAFSIGLLQSHFEETLNVVNTPFLAKQRGISVDETKNADALDWANSITIRVMTDETDHAITGTVYDNNIPRIVSIDDYMLEVSPVGALIVILNEDHPGVIGAVGTVCGTHNINIDTMGVGCFKAAKRAALAINTDKLPSEEALASLRQKPYINMVIACELPDGYDA